MLSISAILLLPAVLSLPAYRTLHVEAQQPGFAFASALSQLPQGKSLVFVKEASDQHPEWSVVQNVVDMDRAPVLVAHDRGERDSLLVMVARDRRPFLAVETRTPTETTFRIEPLTSVAR